MLLNSTVEGIDIMSLALSSLLTSLLTLIDSSSISLPKSNCCLFINQPINLKYSVRATSISERKSSFQTTEEIANQVTVRILSKESSGSGVIISRQGETYTVLTNEHVLKNAKDKDYRILTVDGLIHSSILVKNAMFVGADLAIVKFNTNNNYQVVALGDSSSLSLDDPVYAAGFPNYYFPIDSNVVEATYNWGRRAFRLTVGDVRMLPLKSLREGYGLGYTNEVVDGMSGGPVLNQKGELVGINGKLKYSLQEEEGYLFIDGTRPSQHLFEQMRSLSWAIPSSSFVQFLSIL